MTHFIVSTITFLVLFGILVVLGIRARRRERELHDALDEKIIQIRGKRAARAARRP